MLNHHVILFIDFVNEEGEGYCYYTVVHKLDIKELPDPNLLCDLLAEEGDEVHFEINGPGDAISKASNTSISYGLSFTLKEEASDIVMKQLFDAFLGVLQGLDTFEKGTKLEVKVKKLSFGG